MAGVRLVQALLCTLLIGLSSAQTLGYLVDATQVTGPWNHYYERCVGSDHALMGLRADWQAAMRQVRQDIGFQQVRFHGIFVDDMSTLLSFPPAVYSFRNIDLVYDFLLSIGMKPYVELSFMPFALASGNSTVFHYQANNNPPKNYSDWANLITAFADHIIDRYGLAEVSTWNFEVWNEPNCGFWTGTQAEYFQLYAVTATALKAVSSSLKVGGPATCQSQWLPEFMQYIAANKLPCDFISTHEYPTDITPVTRNTMAQVFATARAQVGNATTLYYSEYNDGLWAFPTYHDTPYASSFIVKTAMDGNGVIDMASWWTFSDIFEEGGLWSTPFGGPDQWGLLDLYGIPKPSYRAFQLLHQSGNETVYVKAPSTDTTVGAYAIRNPANNSLMVFVYNFQAVGNTSVANETVQITIAGLGSKPNPVSYRIDTANSNAPALWVTLGQPEYPTQAQIKAMQAASELHPSSTVQVTTSKNTATANFVIPPSGVVVIQLSLL